MTNNMLIAAIAIISFVVIWTLACAIIARFGWRNLASRYRTDSPPQGNRYSGQSILIGRLASYNGCVNIHINQDGLHLAVFFIFRVGHPSLFIPWSAVRLLRKHNGLFGQRFLYDLGTPRICRVAISGEIHRAIQQVQSGA